MLKAWWRELYIGVHTLASQLDTVAAHRVPCKNRIGAIPKGGYRIAAISLYSGPCREDKGIIKDDAMKDFVDGTAFNFEQGQRARKLFAAVVLAALDDAIADDKKYGNGPEQIARWARSRDGREVLSCAGIDPNER